ncbi:DNA-binding protein [Streptomyces sp. W16]|uniref:DNA-binding protein n=1 Tax=Streptomyces sp. W16 TaxID=3076631 RepID=UPI00295AF8B3|nr:DNA-binding protein [Streptomyces sp. W16]MDV9170944.1 DNA-binding protein [Streptomyces sp. W16]
MGRVSRPRASDAARRPLATVPELAEHYSVPEKTVHRWHQTQTCIGPLMFRVGKYLRARWDDVDSYDADQAGGQRAA